MRRGEVSNKLKQNKAFTLMEMLIVVALVVVLSGISMLFVSDMMARLKVTELDNHAKTIYLEAQNQLAAREVDGGMPGFYNSVREGYSARFLQEKPQDYTGDTEAWKQLCYLGKRDAITELVLSTDSNSYKMGGYYLIEFNPQTGDVYGVFYWDKDSAMNYGEDIRTLSGRTVSDRLKKEIGYYGGTETSTTTVSKDFDLDQQVELINSEELYLKVSYEYSERLLLDYYSGLTVTLTIQDEHNHIWTKKMDMSNVKVAERLEMYYLLDSLTPGKRFADITKGSGLVPGDKLTIRVQSVFSQGAYYCVSPTMEVEGNSLFESKSHNEFGATIHVSTLRHLMNLDASAYTLPTGSGVGQKVTILQMDDIDMEYGPYAWEAGSYKGVGKVSKKPLSAVAPITNGNIFENAGNRDVSAFYGTGYEIKNVKVQGTGGNVGLFSSATYTNFMDIKLEDIIVDGGNGNSDNNVGALVGNIRNCLVQNCGVYLTVYSDRTGVKQYYSQNQDATYGNEMEMRCQTRIVTGNQNVGGLLGYVADSTIQESYAAIKTVGSRYVGGLIGYGDNVTINKCYSSGDVVASGAGMGGFMGYANGITVTDAYSSGDIYGTDCFGGFVGESRGSTYTSCKVYGEILNIRGARDFTGRDAGGFICNEGNKANNQIGTDCKYLRQRSYNTGTGFKEPAEMYIGYGLLVEEGSGLSIGESFPYSGTLLYKAFPFEKVTGHHYGDWPLQYLINTSLVYYELYEDGTYGYYGVTTLTSKEEGQVVDDYMWVLDSLRDTECIEDGYAILSMYYLTEFDYLLDVGTSGTNDYQGTLTVSTEYGKDKVVLLRQQGFLEFRAYDPLNSSTEDNYSADYTGRTIRDIFTISGMYLYQLPFDLQCTNRYGVENFYDKFTVNNAFAKGNKETPVIDGLSFFYSPHFAKTAVNPGVGSDTVTSLPNPDTVHVRSARQLNALGRVPYYWNKEGGLDDTMSFVQEVDINFGTYVKNYCGEPYDLMDTSQPYANQPIGMPDLTGTYKQFRNSYDGQCNKIIDFNLQTDRQFAGLFGEIQGATLKNIVMTVSEKGAGRIVSSYHPSDSDKRAGLGALVGLVYQGSNTVENCTAAGYDVQYYLNEIPQGSSGLHQPKGIAVGGLIGLSMGDITRCSAANDVKLVVNASYGKNGAVFLGGFTGSFYYGTLKSVYSGGTIDIDMNNDYATIYRLRIGGLCPGFMYTAYASFNESDSVCYEDIYTYTRVTDSILTYNSRLDGNGLYDHLIPAVGRMAWNKGGTGNTTCLGDVSVPRDHIAYYYQPYYQGYLDLIPEKSAVWDYFTKHECDDNRIMGIFKQELGKTCDPASYDVLSNLPSMPNEDMKHAATGSYPLDESLLGQNYPFPAVITDAEGNYVHYGDWPTP